jgi:ribosomal protein S18 acetylase RimI-like enzyme
MADQTDAQLDSAAGSLRCRPQLPGDETFLWEVYAGTRQEELDLTDWGPEQRKVFLDSQFKAMRVSYASQFPRGEFSVIMLGAQRIGLMVVDRAQNELRLVDIALLPEFRGRGIGTFFLRELVSESALAQKPLRLHVLTGSRPRRLYARLGFVKIEEDGPYEHWERRPQAVGRNPPGSAAS